MVDAEIDVEDVASVIPNQRLGPGGMSPCRGGFVVASTVYLFTRRGGTVYLIDAHCKGLRRHHGFITLSQVNITYNPFYY